MTAPSVSAQMVVVLAALALSTAAWAQVDCGMPAECYRRGLDYRNGSNGFERDDVKAAAHYRRACDGGNAPGCTNLGYMYRMGRGVAQDQNQAVLLYRNGCDGGNADGCRNLGYMYENGLGVAQDQNQAVLLYRNGCDGGDAAGCTNLGTMYTHGRGVAQDSSQAVSLYSKGCDGGNAQGCSYLGDMYEYGKGVAKSLARAKELYRQGCDGGHEWGCGRLSREEEQQQQRERQLLPEQQRRGPFIQVFASTDEGRAKAMMERLLGAGYHSFLSTFDNQGQRYFRVRLGPFEDRERARQRAADLERELGLDTWIPAIE